MTQPQYPPEHVHATKKLIASRLGTTTRRVSEMMEWSNDPMPVVYDQVIGHWVITEGTLAAWTARHRLSAQEARKQGVVRGRGRKAS